MVEVFPLESFLDNEEVQVDLSEDVPAEGVVYDDLQAIAPDEEFPDEVGFYQNVEMPAEISAELEVGDDDVEVEEDNEDLVVVSDETVDQDDMDDEEEDVLIVDLEEDIVREEEEEPLN